MGKLDGKETLVLEPESSQKMALSVREIAELVGKGSSTIQYYLTKKDRKRKAKRRLGAEQVKTTDSRTVGG